MAFTEIRPKLIKDSASVGSSGLEETQIWLVVSDSPADSAAASLFASAGGITIPAYLSQHPTYPKLFVIYKSANRKGNTFEVTIKYGVPVVNFEQPLPEATTEKWNKRVSISGQCSVEPVQKSVTGKPIINTYGDPFVPGLNKEYWDEVINVQFSTRTVDVQKLGEARGRINSDQTTMTITKGNYVRIFPSYTLKLTEASYSIATAEDGTAYWDVSITLVYRHQMYKASGSSTYTEIGWDRQVASRGYHYFDTDGTTKKTSDTPVDLDSAGKKLAAGADAYMIRFGMDDAVAFTGTTGVLNGI